MALIKGRNTADAVRDAIVLDLGDLSAQAEQLRAAAERQAERLIAEARQRAEDIEAEAGRRGYERGLAEGTAQGIEDGTRRGHEAALAAMSEDLGRIRDAWIAAAGRWDAERRDMVHDARRSLLGLALTLTRRIVHRVPHVDPSVVTDQVAAAIEYVVRPADIAVRIHPGDRPLVERAMPGLADAFGGCDHLTLIDDDAVERGGCVVTHGNGTIDATLAAQLDRIAETLLPVEPDAAGPGDGGGGLPGDHAGDDTTGDPAP